MPTRPADTVHFMMAAFGEISVFITGCNRGIGLACVKHILQLPASPKHVFATCRSLKAESAQELTQLAAKHSNLHLLEFDVTNASQLAAISSKVEEKLGDAGLNLLINNAGIYDTKGSAYGTKTTSLEEITAETMMKVYETNTIAPLMIAKSFLPLLKQAALDKTSSCHPRAVILNISSEDGSIQLNNTGGYYQYKSSKAALNMVTKSLSIEFAKDAITVVCVDPGWIQTDMGGSAAPLVLSDAIPSLVKLIGSLDQSMTGSFFSYNGSLMPW